MKQIIQLLLESERPTLIKMKLNQKWKIPYALLQGWNLCFNFYKNREVKQKTLSNKRSTWKIKMWLFCSALEIFCSNMFYIFQHLSTELSGSTVEYRIIGGGVGNFSKKSKCKTKWKKYRSNFFHFWFVSLMKCVQICASFPVGFELQ